MNNQSFMDYDLSERTVILLRIYYLINKADKLKHRTTVCYSRYFWVTYLINKGEWMQFNVTMSCRYKEFEDYNQNSERPLIRNKCDWSAAIKLCISAAHYLPRAVSHMCQSCKRLGLPTTFPFQNPAQSLTRVKGTFWHFGGNKARTSSWLT